MRPISRRYRDPLDQVWLSTAAKIGLQVSRSNDVFAASNGEGQLVLGAKETLDADDCLAQMILHELCHSLVQGPENWARPDWGLDNINGDLLREHACLRTQCALLTPLQLREVFAPTTEHRAFYDRLPDDPLHGESDDVRLAQRAMERSGEAPWHPHLPTALLATRDIVRVASSFAAGDDLLHLNDGAD